MSVQDCLQQACDVTEGYKNSASTSAATATTQANKSEVEADKSAASAVLSATSANFKGVWSSITAYIVGQSVSVSGTVYRCLVNNTNQNPTTAPTYWEISLPFMTTVGTVASPLFDIQLKNSLDIKAGVGMATFTRASTKTYRDRYGNLAVAAIDEATFGKYGYFNEDEGTNAVTYSEAMSDNSRFVLASGMTRGSTTILAPDSVSTTACEFIPIAGVASYVYRNTTPSSIGLNTLSVFVKKGGGTLDSFTLLSPDSWFTESTNPQINFTFSTKTFIVTDAFSNIKNYGFEEYANSWVRLWMTVEVDTAVTGSVHLRNNITTLNGITDSFYALGLQCEVGEYMTSYIPTTTTAVTRAKDVLKVAYTNNCPDIVNDDITIVCDIRIAGLSTLSELPKTVWSITTSSYYMLRSNFTGANVGLWNGSAVSCPSPFIVDKTYRVACVLELNKASIYVNGVLLYTNDTTKSPLVLGSGTISIGSEKDISVNQMQGYITNFRIYDKALTATEAALA